MNLVSRRAACEFVVVLVAILAVMAPTAEGEPTATSSTSPAQTITVRGPVTTVATRDWLDYAQLFAIGLAFVTVLVIRQQLRSSDRAARQERSAEQAAVWMNRDFRTVLSPVWSFFEVRDVDDCIAKVRAWVTAPHSEDASLPSAEDGPPLKKNDINHVLGVIEEAAVRYNRGAVDRDWVERLLGPAFVAMFDRCLWFLVFFRVQEGWPSMCNEWEAMVRDLRESRTASLRSIHIVRNIRALPETPAPTIRGDLRGNHNMQSSKGPCDLRSPEPRDRPGRAVETVAPALQQSGRRSQADRWVREFPRSGRCQRPMDSHRDPHLDRLHEGRRRGG